MRIGGAAVGEGQDPVGRPGGGDGGAQHVVTGAEEGAEQDEHAGAVSWQHRGVTERPGRYVVPISRSDSTSNDVAQRFIDLTQQSLRDGDGDASASKR